MRNTDLSPCENKSSEKTALPADGRRAKLIGSHLETGWVQPQTSARQVKALTKQIGPQALPSLTGAESGVVILAATQGLHTSHDAICAIRVVLFKPLSKER
jgi:hypothetical protein